jgi:signal transduction histidine kinase
MAPHTPSRELLGPYSEALRAYLEGAQNAALLQARELGNRALMSGLCAAEMCAIHHESLRGIGIPVTSGAQQLAERSDSMTAAATFLAESLMAFSVDQQELRLLNTALRRQNDRLEGELRRVSRIVYDEALQLVSATRLMLAGAHLEPPPAVWNLLERLEEQLTSCSGSLQPRLLEDLGLASAIQFLSRRFAADCQFDVTADAAIGPVPAPIGIALYRSVLEALTNVHRHARASRVQIRLCQDCSVIRCSIRDDGIGFDISSALSQAEVQGSGFVFIQESLRLVGGTLVVDSVPGGGTELRISICPRVSD